MSNVTISIIIYIVIIVWGILNVILFFKIWGMCDNVKKLCDFIIEEDPEEEKYYKRNTKQESRKNVLISQTKQNKLNNMDKQELMMAFNDECLRLYKKCKSKEEFEEGVDGIVSIYNETGTFDYSTLKDGLWEQFKQL